MKVEAKKFWEKSYVINVNENLMTSNEWKEKSTGFAWNADPFMGICFSSTLHSVRLDAECDSECPDPRLYFDKKDKELVETVLGIEIEFENETY